MHIRHDDFGADFLHSVQRRDEFVQGLAILVRRNDRRFLMALILNFEKALWFRGSLVNCLPELECNHWILSAVDHEKRNAGVL